MHDAFHELPVAAVFPRCRQAGGPVRLDRCAASPLNLVKGVHTMSATPLRLRITRPESDVTVIQADGEIDMSSCSRLRAALLDSLEHGTTVLDMAQIDFCDSAGLRTLAEAQQVARACGIALRLVAPSEAVGRVLELAGAADMFEIHPDVPAALKA